MAKGRKTFDVGRDSKTGHFIPVKEAKERPRETTVERVPKRGYGDTENESTNRRPNTRHCEERSDEAISLRRTRLARDCFASLAMTVSDYPYTRRYNSMISSLDGTRGLLAGEPEARAWLAIIGSSSS